MQSDAGAGNEPGRRKLVGVQYLRAVATVIIMAFHLGTQMRRLGYAAVWPVRSAGPVDIFFVVSGFMIVLLTWQAPVVPVAFLRRRAIRLVPVYWLLSGAMLAVLLVRPQWLQSSRLDPMHLVRSFLFVPARTPGKAEMAPLLMPGWSLNYEALFYLVFAAALAAWRRQAPALTIAVMSGLYALYLSGRVDRLSVTGFYASTLALDVAAGVALAWLLLRRGRGIHVPVPTAVTLVAAGIAGSLLAPGLPGERAGGTVAAVASLAGMLAIEEAGALPRIGWLERIGDASYSIYLAHTIAFAAWMQVWRLVPLGTTRIGLAMFAISAMGVGLASGLLCYRLVERPLDRRWRRPRVIPAVPADIMPAHPAPH